MVEARPGGALEFAHQIDCHNGDGDQQGGIVVPCRCNVAVQQSVQGTLRAATRALVAREGQESASREEACLRGVEGEVDHPSHHSQSQCTTIDQPTAHHHEPPAPPPPNEPPPKPPQLEPPPQPLEPELLPHPEPPVKMMGGPPQVPVLRPPVPELPPLCELL